MILMAWSISPPLIPCDHNDGGVHSDLSVRRRRPCRHIGLALQAAGTRSGCQDNPLRGPHSLEEIRSRIGTMASRHAVIGLEQGKISRSWQLDVTTSRWRPGLTRVLHVPASPARTGRDRDALAVPLGQAPSGRGRQRPPRPRCLIPCRPVSPVSRPGRTEPCSYYKLYYSARHAKGPLPAEKGP